MNIINLLSKVVLALISCSLLNSANAREPNVSDIEVSEGSKILIVYLTRTKNTKAIAEIIHSKVGGKLVSVKLKTPYPENYEVIVEQVDNENESGFLPPLETKIDDIEKYDIVFIGFPTWDMQLPPPMKSFLSQHDLSGKKVIPFNTNGGYGVGSSFNDVRQLCTDCNVMEGFSMKGGLERDGVYLAIQGEKRDTAREKVHQWLLELSPL